MSTQMLRNFFGHPKASPLDVFYESRDNVKQLIKKQLSPLFHEVGQNPEAVLGLIEEEVKRQSEHHKTNLTNGLLSEFERDIRIKLQFDGKKLNEWLDRKFSERAMKICTQIGEIIESRYAGRTINLADVGCGDGLVTKLLTEQLSEKINFQDIALMDVINYLDPTVEKLVAEERFQFIEIPEVSDDFQLGKKFDCVLLLTVLHHSEHPATVYNACSKLLTPNGIMIVIESCVDLNTEDVLKYPSILNAKSVLHDSTGLNGSAHNDLIKHFLELDQSDQMLYATFIDWFYNRVLHQDVNVPYNFTSPIEWNDTFQRNSLMPQIIDLYIEGFDQLLVPEFHTIHILKRNE